MTNLLIGKTLKKLMIAEDKKALLFQCDDKDYVVRVDAGCCSETWIEAVDITVLSFPCKITNIVNLDLNKEDESTSDYGNVIAFYGARVVTDKGNIEIDYRNASNGYYGGSIAWPKGDYYHFYGGVYGQNISEEKWIDIKEQE